MVPPWYQGIKFFTAFSGALAVKTNFLMVKNRQKAIKQPMPGEITQERTAQWKNNEHSLQQIVQGVLEGRRLPFSNRTQNTQNSPVFMIVVHFTLLEPWYTTAMPTNEPIRE